MAQRKQDIVSTIDVATYTEFKEQNIRKRYMDNESKQNIYRAIQIGVYAMKQGLSNQESKKAIDDMNSTKELINGR